MRFTLYALGLFVLVCDVGDAHAQPFSVGGAAHAQKPTIPWCDEGVEALSDGICHINGGLPESGRRTLVIFLHGAIAKDVNWQFTQERALTRQARAGKFTALFPRAPL